MKEKQLEIVERDDICHIVYGDDVLSYSAEFGGPVWLNNHKIPHDRVWGMFAKHAADGTEMNLDRLFRVAKESELYRLVPTDRLIVTERPLETDRPTPVEGAYLRTEPQRVRPMFKTWNVLSGIISGEATETAIDTLVAAFRALGYEPVDEIDGKYFAIAEGELLAFTLETTGGARPPAQTLAKFLKRPGTAPIELTLIGDVFREPDNDGTLVISNQIQGPMQGTLYGYGPDGLVMAKGMVRPPFLRRMPNGTYRRENYAHVDVGAFGRRMAKHGSFYPIAANTKETCRMNYQTATFSFRDPYELIMQDTADLDTTVQSVLSETAKAKAAAGIPTALLVGDFSPWKLVSSLSRPGIRAKVYGSELVPIGTFCITRKLFNELEVILGENPNQKTFLVHRDPALPDGSSTFEAKCLGEIELDVDFPDRGPASRCIVLNPLDPKWKAAGGDFDGDSAAIFVGGDFELLTTVPRRSFKTTGSKFHGLTIDQRFKLQATEQTDKLLGPLVLNSMKLMERGLMSESLRSEAASAIQASVESKKHMIDHEQVMSIAQEIFASVRTNRNAFGGDFISAKLNALKAASGDAAKVEAWIELVNHAKWILGSMYGTRSAEVALAHRVLRIHELYTSISFLKHAVRPELPTLLRNRARDLRTDAAAETVCDITDEYRSILRERDELRRLGHYDSGYATESEFEVHLQELRRQLSVVRSRFKYYLTLGTDDSTAEELQVAMLAYGPPKLAAQFVSLPVIRSMAARSKEVFVNIKDTIESGTYAIKDLDPVPNCVADLKLFGDPDDTVELTVVSHAARSTRVHLRKFSIAGVEGARQTAFTKSEFKPIGDA